MSKKKSKTIYTICKRYQSKSNSSKKNSYQERHKKKGDET